MKKIRVYLADDHLILRDGLRRIFESEARYEIIGESGDGKEALEEIEQLKPDISIIDISLPSMIGIEIVRQLKKYYPDLKIIILTRHENRAYVEQTLKYGVNGYVLKDAAVDDLLHAVETVLGGNIYLSPRITKNLVHDFFSGANRAPSGDDYNLPNRITPRERQILKLLAEGRNNREIAELLHIALKTVKVHRANLMKKLDAHNLADLIKYAVQTDLIES